MSHTLLMVPIGMGVGLSSVSKGLEHALLSQGLKVSYLDLVSYDETAEEEFDLSDVQKPIPFQTLESLLSQGKQEKLLEFLIAHYEYYAKDVDAIVIHGVMLTQGSDYSSRLNYEIFKALDAEVIFVTTIGNFTPEMISEKIEIAAEPYGGISHPKVLGTMINKVGAPVDQFGNARIDLFDPIEKNHNLTEELVQNCPVFKDKNFKLLACFPWDRSLMAPRAVDIQKFLGAKILSPGNMERHRVMHLAMAAATIENVTKIFKPDVMVITSGDRSDVIVATCMAYVNGTPIAALLLTGGHIPDPNTIKLCDKAIEMGLPIFLVETDSLRTSIALQNITMEIPTDDVERLEKMRETMARYVDMDWIKELATTHPERYMSPPAFRYQLIEKAKKTKRTIILPEGEEPRILKAAAICAQRGIAKLVLLGDKKKLSRLAIENDLPLGDGVEIIDPHDVREKYVGPFVEKRKHKGVTESEAHGYLHDPITLGTMMLACGEVDGLVAGASHTTAHTILPALKLVKTLPNAKLVSSIFFMCLPAQVLVYGDCAVNQNPTFEELADIAIQSADSSEAFGIPARVAMISYSTGESGKGADVEKIRGATALVKKLRPDITIDGPLQYDAAFSTDVAKKKAPNSPVAGQATVYIFPDLNTANTTYKAVQRSANVLSIGPMLQGLRKPVNDLSRGATVDDIVFTIAITAIQAGA